MTILAPFAEKNHLKNHFGTVVPAMTGWGVGGPARGLLARAKVLKLGGVEVNAPVVDLSQQKKGSFTDPYVAGNVGGGVLKRFNVTFDYGHQRVIFEPNAPARPHPTLIGRSDQTAPLIRVGRMGKVAPPAALRDRARESPELPPSPDVRPLSLALAR